MALVHEFLVPKLNHHHIAHGAVWFQQDEATARTSNKSMAEIWRLFPCKVISYRGAIDWPHALQIFLNVNFLWGYLKQHVCLDKPRTVGEPKKITERDVRSIPCNMLQRVMANFFQRLKECVKKLVDT